jgi:endogenous inhibitor of DNA gyrase (YacG/DUF329 family)
MPVVRFKCPWCKKEVESTSNDKLSRDDRKRLKDIEIVQSTCPSCKKVVQLTRRRS